MKQKDDEATISFIHLLMTKKTKDSGAPSGSQSKGNPLRGQGKVRGKKGTNPKFSHDDERFQVAANPKFRRKPKEDVDVSIC